ncbi:hypothetical protein C5167_006088 [Papaver somniferum]|uniref:Uncharacterized protein n=1 Tax=Papaver somniferum TaxID=3469 RepID=A0A4Y7JGK8_PAPSO|nr:hypothetical protein C5167_006088 [Papaver somniferum]
MRMSSPFFILSWCYAIDSHSNGLTELMLIVIAESDGKEGTYISNRCVSELARAPLLVLHKLESSGDDDGDLWKKSKDSKSLYKLNPEESIMCFRGTYVHVLILHLVLVLCVNSKDGGNGVVMVAKDKMLGKEDSSEISTTETVANNQVRNEIPVEKVHILMYCEEHKACQLAHLA